MGKTFPAFKEFEKVVSKAIWPQKTNFLLDETVSQFFILIYQTKFARVMLVHCCHVLALSHVSK